MCEILKLYEHISINTNLIQVSEPRMFFSELETLFYHKQKAIYYGIAMLSYTNMELTHIVSPLVCTHMYVLCYTWH